MYYTFFVANSQALMHRPQSISRCFDHAFPLKGSVPEILKHAAIDFGDSLHPW